MSSRLNPGYEDDPTMDIYEADHEWVYDKESGMLIEIKSELRDYSIDLDCVLSVHYPDNDTPITKRKCLDDDHAMAIAAAFERQAERDRDRGETWRGKPVDDRGVPL